MSPASDTRPHPTNGRSFVTDGGIETDLIHRRGVDLPHFAAFPLLDTSEGRALLHRYYDDYALIARTSGHGLMLESPTWRANPDWGVKLGYSAEDLGRVNREAIGMMAGLRLLYLSAVPDIVVGGSVGPRYDGYSPDTRLDPAAASDYHQPQLAAFADAGADLATAYTITHVGEAVGIVRAARTVALRVAISFTVETDGRLPDGMPLRQAIAEVDTVAAPDHFLVNCAHPSHIERALDEPGTWTSRIAGTRANASTASHAQLDEGGALDDGDPAEFSAAQDRLTTRLPHLSILGGCCGTDARHIAAMMHTDIPTTGHGRTP